MHNAPILSFFSDPFSLGRSAFCLKRRHGDYQHLSLREVGNLREPVVVSEAFVLVGELRAGGRTLVPKILDIDDALRLLSGRAKDDGGEKLWSSKRALEPHFSSPAEFKRWSEVYEGRGSFPLGEERLRLLESAADALEKLWRDVQDRLQLQGEYERFEQIEWPTQQLLHYRQLRGLPFSAEARNACLEAARNEKYTAYRAISEALGVSASGLNYRNVGQYLSKTDASHLSVFSDNAALPDYMKLARSTSDFAASFVSYMEASRDVRTLSQLEDQFGRVFPRFHVVGTVTGRILVSDPHLQQLKRRHRSCLVADEGKVLSYIDYAQFEPGIIAALANDDEFLAAYNGGDLYSNLSIAIFGDADHRKECKQAFLAFCYGMSRPNIARLLSGTRPGTARYNATLQNLDLFFGRYPGLDAFKVRLVQKLAAEGFVASVWGNRRYRTAVGPLVAKERRWAISQVIQGTASLIFKEALLELAAEFGSDAVLLPMHDAVLLQFPVAQKGDDTRRASEIMQACFERRFPQVSVRVTSGEFAEKVADMLPAEN
ncbi:DNA polymerase [Parvibaculum sp.]|uniref:DNA polymerase n=1 Tax=Parvibaculum sp. TaxID=2024848 RepID=UPI001B216C35|nr:DNA polymerase [Parvibaculum sp.]MBO6669542.1 hypothetical protein [Parvibaculum sp.]MBO6693670.1 hypothetical protein [Parvibaculum sp.]MBO6715928.1 hypothetical protein [Parvibaculum sp.]